MQFSWVAQEQGSGPHTDPLPKILLPHMQHQSAAIVENRLLALHLDAAAAISKQTAAWGISAQPMLSLGQGYVIDAIRS